MLFHPNFLKAKDNPYETNLSKHFGLSWNSSRNWINQLIPLMPSLPPLYCHLFVYKHKETGRLFIWTNSLLSLSRKMFLSGFFGWSGNLSVCLFLYTATVSIDVFDVLNDRLIYLHRSFISSINQAKADEVVLRNIQKYLWLLTLHPDCFWQI